MGNKRGSASREALLVAGREAFAANRFDEVSIVAVAKSVGAAAGSVGYHFGDKRGFYLAVLAQASDEFWGRLLELHGPAFERLVAGLDLFLDLAESQPRAFEALIADTADPEVRQIHHAHRDRVAHALALEITNTESTPVLQTALNGCLSFIEGSVVYWLNSQSIPRDVLRELLIAAVNNTVLSAISLDPSIELADRAVAAMMVDSLARRHADLAAELPGIGEQPPAATRHEDRGVSS